MEVVLLVANRVPEFFTFSSAHLEQLEELIAQHELLLFCLAQ